MFNLEDLKSRRVCNHCGYVGRFMDMVSTLSVMEGEDVKSFFCNDTCRDLFNSDETELEVTKELNFNHCI